MNKIKVLSALGRIICEFQANEEMTEWIKKAYLNSSLYKSSYLYINDREVEKPQIVYVLTMQDDLLIHGVFKTREAAEKRVIELYGDNKLEEDEDYWIDEQNLE